MNFFCQLFITLLFCLTPLLKLSAHEGTQKTITLAITAPLTDHSATYLYTKLARYLSLKTALNITVTTDYTYSSVELALKTAEIGLAAICPHSYALNKEKLGLKLMVRPSYKLDRKYLAMLGINSPGYMENPGQDFAYTIVRKGSGIKQWSDLKGKSFAISDKKSHSAYHIPVSKLMELGEKSWKPFFRKVLISGSHENSIKMVALGKVDAASVSSAILDGQLLDLNPFAESITVIETVGPTVSSPVVAGDSLNANQIEIIKNAFLKMHEDVEGKFILNELFIDKFISVKDSDFDQIIKQNKLVLSSGFINL